jgi:mRNA-degrading endonuclease RelE of RelBE toxin-antitoxin system
MTYTPLYKPQFAEDLKTYASLKKQIESKVKAILANPYHNTEPLEKKGKYDLRGLRSMRIDKSFRIIFAICEECQKLFPDKEKPCRYCDPGLSRKAILFFTVRPHKIVCKEDKPLG